MDGPVCIWSRLLSKVTSSYQNKCGLKAVTFAFMRFILASFSAVYSHQSSLKQAAFYLSCCHTFHKHNHRMTSVISHHVFSSSQKPFTALFPLKLPSRLSAPLPFPAAVAERSRAAAWARGRPEKMEPGSPPLFEINGRGCVCSFIPSRAPRHRRSITPQATRSGPPITTRAPYLQPRAYTGTNCLAIARACYNFDISSAEMKLLLNYPFRPKETGDEPYIGRALSSVHTCCTALIVFVSHNAMHSTCDG